MVISEDETGKEKKYLITRKQVRVIFFLIITYKYRERIDFFDNYQQNVYKQRFSHFYHT